MTFRSGLAGAIAALALLVSGAASSATWQETVAAAERETKLTIVGPPVQPHRETIMQFEKAYPKIKIEFSGMMPDQFEARLAAERAAGKYLWDILISGMSSTVYERQIPQGWFDPLRPVVVSPEALDDSKWVGGFASGFLDAEGQYVYGFGAQLSSNVGYDRKRVDAKSFTYQNLLDPKWQGQIAILDPRGRGPGSVALRQIIHTLGEDGARRLLRDQNVVLGESPRGITEWAVRGRYPIVVGVSWVDLKAFQKQGLGQDVEVYQDPNGFFLTGWATSC
jgi:iron(III) transport system substrate-binding protein